MNPWLVELVACAPPMPLAHYSPPRKRLCLSQTQPVPAPLHLNNDLPGSCGGSGGIQGTRHAQFGISLSDLRFHKLQSGLLEAGNHRPEGSFFLDSVARDRPHVGDSGASSSPDNAPHFLLFGQPILTAHQISQGGGEAAVAPSSERGSHGGSEGGASN